MRRARHVIIRNLQFKMESQVLNMGVLESRVSNFGKFTITARVCRTCYMTNVNRSSE